MQEAPYRFLIAGRSRDFSQVLGPDGGQLPQLGHREPTQPRSSNEGVAPVLMLRESKLREPRSMDSNDWRWQARTW